MIKWSDGDDHEEETMTSMAEEKKEMTKEKGKKIRHNGFIEGE